jgi:hypothetical protein
VYVGYGDDEGVLILRTKGGGSKKKKLQGTFMQNIKRFLLALYYNDL